MNQANLSSIKWLPVIAISATIVFMFSPMVAGAAGINSTTPQITVTHITGSPPFQASPLFLDHKKNQIH